METTDITMDTITAITVTITTYIVLTRDVIKQTGLSYNNMGGLSYVTEN